MTWDALNKDKPKIANSVDGYVRTEKEETELNKHFANVFKNDEGKKVLSYLDADDVDKRKDHFKPYLGFLWGRN